MSDNDDLLKKTGGSFPCFSFAPVKEAGKKFFGNLSEGAKELARKVSDYVSEKWGEITNWTSKADTSQAKSIKTQREPQQKKVDRANKKAANIVSRDPTFTALIIEKQKGVIKKAQAQDMEYILLHENIFVCRDVIKGKSVIGDQISARDLQQQEEGTSIVGNQISARKDLQQQEEGASIVFKESNTFKMLHKNIEGKITVISPDPPIDTLDNPKPFIEIQKKLMRKFDTDLKKQVEDAVAGNKNIIYLKAVPTKPELRATFDDKLRLDLKKNPKLVFVWVEEHSVYMQGFQEARGALKVSTNVSSFRDILKSIDKEFVIKDAPKKESDTPPIETESAVDTNATQIPQSQKNEEFFGQIEFLYKALSVADIPPFITHEETIRQAGRGIAETYDTSPGQVVVGYDPEKKQYTCRLYFEDHSEDTVFKEDSADLQETIAKLQTQYKEALKAPPSPEKVDENEKLQGNSSTEEPIQSEKEIPHSPGEIIVRKNESGNVCRLYLEDEKFIDIPVEASQSLEEIEGKVEILKNNLDILSKGKKFEKVENRKEALSSAQTNKEKFYYYLSSSVPGSIIVVNDKLKNSEDEIVLNQIKFGDTVDRFLKDTYGQTQTKQPLKPSRFGPPRSTGKSHIPRKTEDAKSSSSVKTSNRFGRTKQYAKLQTQKDTKQEPQDDYQIMIEEEKKRNPNYKEKVDPTPQDDYQIMMEEEKRHNPNYKETGET